MSSNNNNEILRGFSAEALLGEDAHVIKEILALRNDLQYTTKGSEVSLDDSFIRLQQEVDALPRIVLDMDVPPGTENEYLIRLSTAQEKVLDDCDRVLRRTLEFQSKLKNAERAVKKYKADFMAWYILSAAYVVKSHDVKFSAPQIKQLAEAEFSRLISNLDVQIDNLINSVEHLVEEVRQHKKIQSEKHSLGKDQANASWTSKMANPNGIAPSRADDMAQGGFDTEEEEEDEDVPAFVSRRPQVGTTSAEPAEDSRHYDNFGKGNIPQRTVNIPSDEEIIAARESAAPKIVASNQDLLDQAKPDTVILRFTDNVAPMLEGIKDQVRITGPVTLPVVLAEPEQVVKFLNEDEPEPEPQPKFRVHGETDPKFATSWTPEPEHAKAIEVVRELLADPNPDRNYTFREAPAGNTVVMKPRKKLILTEDEDLM